MNFNKTTSSWTFTYIAIYGAMSLLFGVFTAITNIFISINFLNTTLSFKEFFTIIWVASIYLTGIISISSLLFIILWQIIKSPFCYTITAIYLLLIGISVHKYLGATHGAGIYFIYYFIAGIPITTVLFIIPLIVLFFLELFNKISPPAETIFNKNLALAFFIYALAQPFSLLFLIIDF